MNKIYSIINERSGGKYADLRFGKVVFTGAEAVVTVVCPADRLEAVRDDTGLLSLIEGVCGFNTPVRTEFVADNMSVRELRDAARAFTSRLPYVASVADGITATLDPPTVTVTMHTSMYDLAKGDYIPRLEEHLKNMFTSPVKVVARAVEYTAEDDAAREPRYYTVSSVQPVMGTPDAAQAISAADVSGNNEGIAVCGVLTMLTDFMSKGSGVKRSRPYTKFLLYDGDGLLQCRAFPQDGTQSLAKLANKQVVAVGNTEVERGRGDEAVMTVRSLALCEGSGPDVMPRKKAPAGYTSVKPAPYEEYVQASLFGAADAVPHELMGTFVAFDFETTGLSLAYDSPTELGAVKIKDGVITETFSTLIDPRRPIPEEVSKKTGITDDMVKGKPLFEDVIPDFYKFTDGCALIGHNIAFDFPFLIKHGNRHGYSFADRPTYDTMGMAPRALPGIDVLTLDRVLEMLGLVNDNAHRALSDATATAKAFIAMTKILYGT